MVTDNQGAKETTLQYYPYGNLSLVNGLLPIANDQRLKANDKLYTGQRKDFSSDLYFYNARYYNPMTGNFISADKAEGPNRYAYVGNNPVMRNDPSGNRVCDDDDCLNQKPIFKYSSPEPVKPKPAVAIQSPVKPKVNTQVNSQNIFTPNLAYMHDPSAFKYYPQPFNTGYGKNTCGPTAVSMVFSQYEEFSGYTPEVVIKEMFGGGYSKKSRGAWVNEIAEYAQDKNFPQAKSYTLGKASNIKQGLKNLSILQQKIQQTKSPAIVGVHIGFDLNRPWHDVALLGTEMVGEKKMYAVMDPFIDPYITEGKAKEYGIVLKKNYILVPEDVFYKNFNSVGGNFVLFGPYVPKK